MTARSIVVAVVLGLLASVALPACDPCQAALAIHQQRCFEEGDRASCDWLDAHATAAGTCH